MEAVAASAEQEFNEEERGALVAVGEPLVRYEPMQQRSGLLMDAPVVAVLGTGEGGLDGVAAQRAGEAVHRECPGVQVERVAPGNPVMASRRSASSRKASCRSRTISSPMRLVT